MDSISDEIESILYIAREVSVFKIPPLKVNEGHRAAEWGDLGAPLWKGRMRIIEKGEAAALMLEDGQTGELFARAEYDPARPSVEAVLDSLAERTDSFDFNVALQDYTKRWKARKEPPTEDEPSPHVPTGPKKDYSLKEGQTFSISIPGRSKTTSTKTGSGADLLGGGGTSSGSGGGGGGFPLLPPPPGGGVRKR
ncbi:hypothetical protein BD626DRAFT_574396 [Schizophyllum amplum]|uniref:NECAP PHear domain-containing protein n=1 Tax=Schizophyllum amplum TaxID=97359 RepID=A0A550BYH3_9AGAR|nr:hypothetical protein BD626DRAFT_574396 [Auriculariopsis ampla]